MDQLPELGKDWSLDGPCCSSPFVSVMGSTFSTTSAINLLITRRADSRARGTRVRYYNTSTTGAAPVPVRGDSVRSFGARGGAGLSGGAEPAHVHRAREFEFLQPLERVLLGNCNARGVTEAVK